MDIPELKENYSF